jgi:hypothetical protein
MRVHFAGEVPLGLTLRNHYACVGNKNVMLIKTIHFAGGDPLGVTLRDDVSAHSRCTQSF